MRGEAWVLCPVKALPRVLLADRASSSRKPVWCEDRKPEVDEAYKWRTTSRSALVEGDWRAAVMHASLSCDIIPLHYARLNWDKYRCRTSVASNCSETNWQAEWLNISDWLWIQNNFKCNKFCTMHIIGLRSFHVTGIQNSIVIHQCYKFSGE